jgi:hypothetical protein
VVVVVVAAVVVVVMAVVVVVVVVVGRGGGGYGGDGGGDYFGCQCVGTAQEASSASSKHPHQEPITNDWLRLPLPAVPFLLSRSV